MPTEYMATGAETASFSPVLFSIFTIITIIVSLIYTVVLWKLFTKAYKPGWYALIPIVNIWQVFKIVWGKGWPSLFVCVPIVGTIIWAIVSFKYAKSFGCGIGMTLLMFFFTPIALPILAFGNYEYYGVDGEESDDYEYYDQFRDDRAGFGSILGMNIRKFAYFIRSLIIATVVLGVIIGYLFFFTDVEFKFDPRDKGPVITTEETVSGGYKDNLAN